MQEVAKVAEPETKARAQRVTVIMSATLIDEQGVQASARIRNFSATGFGLTTELPLRIGEQLCVKLRDLTILGKVVRHNRAVYGIQIIGEIDLAELSQQRAQKKNFVVSDLHKIAERTYRPGVKKQY
jgi:PilZ domain